MSFVPNTEIIQPDIIVTPATMTDDNITWESLEKRGLERLFSPNSSERIKTPCCGIMPFQGKFDD